jgi:DNA-binding winged helix-turn-helix (wHTH) protein/Tfp pilus assembly protein PilF
MEGLQMKRPRQKKFCFGQFEADIESGELFQSGKKVHLQAKPFSLLATLLEYHGEVVTRESLSSQLWPDTFVQADQGLNAAVRKVRRALRDDAENPKYIETLGSRGYRFIHPVTGDEDQRSSTSNWNPANARAVRNEGPAPSAITDVRNEQTPEDYLCGRYFLELQTRDSLKNALEYFQASTASYPQFALGYCGLADAYLSEGMSELLLPRKAWELAREPAIRALELNLNLADAYLPLAMTQLCMEHDWAAAKESLDRALSLNPDLCYVYFWYSFFLGAQGDTSVSLEMAERAKRLSPLSLPMNSALSFAAFFAGDFDRAVTTANHILKLDDRFPFAHEALGMVAEAKGNWDDAVRHYEAAAGLSGRWPTILGYLGYSYARTGNVTAARSLLRELEQNPMYTPSFELAVIHLGLGDPEASLRYLDLAYEDRSSRVLLLKEDRRFKSLERNTGFKELVSRIFISSARP